jgi:hypothetical protein
MISLCKVLQYEQNIVNMICEVPATIRSLHCKSAHAWHVSRLEFFWTHESTTLND